MTDSELLNNCITHQVWEGASSLKCGFPLPGEPQWAGDMCSSPEIVWFCVAKCCCICSPEAGGHSLLLSDPFPLELLLMGPFFWQKLRLVSCALTERLKGRWQNQTAHLCGIFASWIWPPVFLAHEFSFQPRSRSEQRVKLNFQVASVASHNLISQPDLDKVAGFWLHWKVGLDQTHPPLNSIAVWTHGGQGDMISPGSPTFSHLLPVWGEPAVSAGGLGLVRLAWNFLWGLVGDNSWLGSLCYCDIQVLCTRTDASGKMLPQISTKDAILMSLTKQILLTLHTKVI